MSVSPVSGAVHQALVRPASEAAEAPGHDHDGDGDDAASVRPASGQAAPGGGIYL